MTDILQSTDPPPLPTEDMDLLNLCLTSTYFRHNGKKYKKLHGTAMGSPVSVVVAEIVMQNIEESARSTLTNDTTLVTLRWQYFHRRTTRRNRCTTTSTDKTLTYSLLERSKKMVKLPFLDCLVGHDDNSLRTAVYRKPTHTDRLLDESSYNPTSHKATTTRTLTRQAQLVY